jgi:two-component system response regulator NreC
MDNTRVLICDDHMVVRAGVQLMLTAEPGFLIVGEATTAAEAIRLTELLHPDIVIMDLNLPDGSGLDAIRVIRRQAPATAVLVLTVHAEPAYLERALQAGAAGYMLKEAAAADLPGVVRLIVRGNLVVPANVARAMLGHAESNGSRPAEPALSERETAILQLIAAGQTNQDIATQLFVSLRTVERERTNLMHKLGLQTKLDLVRYALDHDLP